MKSMMMTTTVSKDLFPVYHCRSLLAIFAILSLCCWSHVESAALGQRRREAPNGRSIVFNNQSGRRVEIYWINRHVSPNTFHPNSSDGDGYAYGATAAISSYIGHEFEIRELPGRRSKQCKIPGKCQKGHVQVNDQENQEVLIDKDFNIIFEDAQTKAHDQASKLLDECQMNILTESKGVSSLDEIDPLVLVDQLTDCMETRVNETLSIQEEERQFQASLRKQMAHKLVPYACGDVNFTDSAEVINKTWYYSPPADVSHSFGQGARFEYQMRIYHERPTSQIFSVKNFMTSLECQAMMEHFVSKDGSYISYAATKDKTKQGQLVAAAASRLYELVRAATGWTSLSIEEDYMTDKDELFRIEHDATGVTVLPTCTQEALDEAKQSGTLLNDCRLPGAMHAPVPTKVTKIERDSNQVADVFLFCGQPPSQLGGIHFPVAGVHLNPEANLLVMATHKAPSIEAGETTWPEYDGFTTEFHLCPNHRVLTHSFFAHVGGAGTKVDSKRPSHVEAEL